MKEKKSKNDDRLIAKMIAASLISLGIAGVGTGALLGNITTTENQDNYVNDPRYITAMTSLSLGATSIGLGVACVAGINSSKDDENENTL